MTRALLLGLSLLLPMLPAQASLPSLLDEARSTVFQPIDQRAQDDALRAFSDPQTSRWATLGMQTSAVSQGLVIHEGAGQHAGRGLFLLRSSASLPLLIQAPHQYHDLDTGRIARLLAADDQVLAVGWNTAHRYLTADSDLAHAPFSYLHAQALAFAARHPDGLLLQLHGYGAAPSRAGVQAIVSNGTRQPDPRSRQFAGCLAAGLQIEVRLFPESINELGATTNTIGAALRAAGFAGFLHLEMDRDLRRRLVAEPAARQQLLDCAGASL